MPPPAACSAAECDALRASLFDNGLLELTLLPTEQCNFRCRYCYESFLGGRMSPATVASIAALIEKRVPTLHTLRIGWFGGEPLLVKDIVVAISSLANDRCRTHGVRFDSGMSTNGYLLTPEAALRLIESGVTCYQITLDGDALYHDTVRIRRDGKPTFARIWQNLLALRETSLAFVVNLRVHLSKRNLASIERLTATLNESFAGDPRFRVHFKPVMDLGGAKSHLTDLLSQTETATVTRDVIRTLGGDVDVRLPDDDAEYICYAARPTAFVIRHDGSIAKCTIGLDDAENRVGQLRPGGVIDIDHRRFRPWIRGAARVDRTMLRCPRATLTG